MNQVDIFRYLVFNRPATVQVARFSLFGITSPDTLNNEDEATPVLSPVEFAQLPTLETMSTDLGMQPCNKN